MGESGRKRLAAKETLRSNIRDYIQQQIAEGVYRPGDRIVETRLAKELNVSQAPVREAMLELSTIGMLALFRDLRAEFHRRGDRGHFRGPGLY